MLEIVIREVLWSIRGTYSVIWSLPPANVKFHSDPWPTVTSQPIRLSNNFITLIPSLNLTKLWVVSMEYLQWVWHASRERVQLQTSGSVPFLGTCICFNYWDQFSRHYTDLMTVKNLTFIELREVSMEYLQRVWHTSRERLPYRTLVPSPFFGLAGALIVETIILELAMSLLDALPWMSLGTFPILPLKEYIELTTFS